MLRLVIRQKQTTKLLCFRVTILVCFSQGIFHVSNNKWTFAIFSQGNGYFLCFADIVEMYMGISLLVGFAHRKFSTVLGETVNL